MCHQYPAAAAAAAASAASAGGERMEDHSFDKVIVGGGALALTCQVNHILPNTSELLNLLAT